MYCGVPRLSEGKDSVQAYLTPNCQTVGDYYKGTLPRCSSSVEGAVLVPRTRCQGLSTASWGLLLRPCPPVPPAWCGKP